MYILLCKFMTCMQLYLQQNIPVDIAIIARCVFSRKLSPHEVDQFALH